MAFVYQVSLSFFFEKKTVVGQGIKLIFCVYPRTWGLCIEIRLHFLEKRKKQFLGKV